MEVPQKYRDMFNDGINAHEIFINIYFEYKVLKYSSAYSYASLCVQNLFSLEPTSIAFNEVAQKANKVIYRKYFELYDSGYLPEQLILVLKDDGYQMLEAVFVIRTLYNISILDAQEVMFNAGIHEW